MSNPLMYGSPAGEVEHLHHRHANRDYDDQSQTVMGSVYRDTGNTYRTSVDNSFSDRSTNFNGNTYHGGAHNYAPINTVGYAENINNATVNGTLNQTSGARGYSGYPYDSAVQAYPPPPQSPFPPGAQFPVSAPGHPHHPLYPGPYSAGVPPHQLDRNAIRQQAIERNARLREQFQHGVSPHTHGAGSATPSPPPPSPWPAFPPAAHRNATAPEAPQSTQWSGQYGMGQYGGRIAPSPPPMAGYHMDPPAAPPPPMDGRYSGPPGASTPPMDGHYGRYTGPPPSSPMDVRYSRSRDACTPPMDGHYGHYAAPSAPMNGRYTGPPVASPTPMAARYAPPPAAYPSPESDNRPAHYPPSQTPSPVWGHLESPPRNLPGPTPSPERIAKPKLGRSKTAPQPPVVEDGSSEWETSNGSKSFDEDEEEEEVKPKPKPKRRQTTNIVVTKAIEGRTSTAARPTRNAVTPVPKAARGKVKRRAPSPVAIEEEEEEHEEDDVEEEELEGDQDDDDESEHEPIPVSPPPKRRATQMPPTARKEPAKRQMSQSAKAIPMKQRTVPDKAPVKGGAKARAPKTATQSPIAEDFDERRRGGSSGRRKTGEQSQESRREQRMRQNGDIPSNEVDGDQAFVAPRSDERPMGSRRGGKAKQVQKRSPTPSDSSDSDDPELDLPGTEDGYGVGSGWQAEKKSKEAGQVAEKRWATPPPSYPTVVVGGDKGLGDIDSSSKPSLSSELNGGASSTTPESVVPLSTTTTSSPSLLRAPPLGTSGNVSGTSNETSGVTSEEYFTLKAPPRPKSAHSESKSSSASTDSHGSHSPTKVKTRTRTKIKKAFTEVRGMLSFKSKKKKGKAEG